MYNKIISEAVNDTFSIFVLQGIVLIGMGILTIIYPQIITWFVAASLIVLGISALVTGIRIKGFGRELEAVEKA